MAKASAKETQSESPLKRTAQLARKLLAVPKAEIDKVRERQDHKRQAQ